MTALKGLDLEIGQGMFGLLGPNGAGKTTLMRILAGLLEPTEGQILFDGKDVTGKPEQVWPHLGYLPQYFGFYPNLTGEKMLRHMLQLKGVSAPGGLKHLCAELLDRVNLTDAAKRKVKGYSGGMRQRLGIAQALAGNPKLVIVDEPTAGLDPEERVRFYRLLAELAEDRTVLLSTHIVEDVAMLCPRFAVIRKGQLLAQTSPSEARKSIASRIYEGRASTADLPMLAERHEVIRTHLVEGQNVVRVYIPRGQDVPVGFAPVDGTLEDAYLHLMQTDELAVPAETGIAHRKTVLR
ncbi:MAG: ABC transporter ATP-binding protein [Bacteroidota bacterium]